MKNLEIISLVKYSLFLRNNTKQMKSISVENLSPAEIQAYLQTAVAPRPIALASTIDAQGHSNLSPFSFFNVFSSNPPILIFSPARRVRDNTLKHTLENVKEIPEVVIGICNYAMVQQVSLSSTEYNREENEFIKAGFTPIQADLVAPSLIKESPVNFECKVLEIKPLGNEGGAGNLVICEVLKIHIEEKYLNSEGKLDTLKLDLISRLGSNWYGRMIPESLFEVPKPLSTKGIGFDHLPIEILNSKILTANDLGMLANSEKRPLGMFSTQEKDHRKAQQFLRDNKLNDAWESLLMKV